MRKRSQADKDLEDEIQAHINMEKQRRIEAGESPESAGQAARKDFGNVQLVKEVTREMWGWGFLERLVQDLRFGARMLVKNPAFALSAIGSLGLGIGASTAIFSIVSGVLVRPLPFERPHELVQAFEVEPRDDSAGAVTRDAFREWRANSKSIAQFVVFGSTSMNLQEAGEAEQVTATRAERSLFTLLGVNAMMGRTFDVADPETVAVASYDWWKSRLAQDPAAIGRSITLDGSKVTIIGVMPEGFRFPYANAATGLWLPSDPTQGRGGRFDGVLARLKPGAPLADAQAELTRLSESTRDARQARLTPLMDLIGAPVRRSLLVLLGAVVLVLLIACANVANLLLAHTASRAREIALREALGATRLRQFSQFLAEGLLLTAGAGLLGLALGVWGNNLLLGLAAGQLPRTSDIGLDWRVFAYLLAACFLTALLFGVLPAVTGKRAASLQSRGARTGLRDLLVVGEIAIAFILLAGAGLLLRTFINLQHTDAGVKTSNVLTAHVILAGANEGMALEDRAARIPGVRAAGIVSLLPLQNSGWAANFTIDGRPGLLPTELRYVTPGYFRAMGIPLRRGRELNARDTPESPRVIVVNEALARQYFPNEDPVGRLTNRGLIVGVSGNVRQSNLAKPAVPEIYYAVSQNFAQIRRHGSTLVVDGILPAASLVAPLRAAIREVLPGQAVFQIATMEQVVDESLARERLYTWLLALFAAIGTLLTIGGTYGVVSYLVALKTVEFGIRMALGAGKRQVLFSVLKKGAVFALFGVAIGAAGAAGLTQLLQGLLYGVEPFDPATFAAVAALLVFVALAACLLPALRATSIDPAVALRSE